VSTQSMKRRLDVVGRFARPAVPVLAFWVIEDRTLSGVLPKGARVLRDYLVDRARAAGQWGGEVVIVHRLARGPRDFAGVIRDFHTKEVIGRVEHDDSLFPERGRTYSRDRLVFTATAGGVS
jgi:hypothetical protein